MNPTECKRHPDSFCYVCGEYMNKLEIRYPIHCNPTFYDKYKKIFNLEISHQDKEWVPHYICAICKGRLSKWESGEKNIFPFKNPILWSQPTDHEKDCYFCLSVIKPGRAKNEYYSSKKPRLSETPNKEKNNEIKKSLSKDDLCNLPGCSSVKVFTSDTENKTSTSDISSNDEEVLQVCEETEDVTPESSIASSDEDILQIISLSNNQTQDMAQDGDDHTLMNLKDAWIMNCKLSPAEFCYICGCYIKKRKEKVSFRDSTTLILAYNEYFGRNYMQQDEFWVPNNACVHCAKILYAWYQGKERFFKFSVPRIWSKPSDHRTDCYFCMVKKESWNKHILKTFKTPELNIPSSLAPIKTDVLHPRPNKRQLESKSSTTIESFSVPSIPDSDYNPSNTHIKVNTKLLNIDEVEDLIRALGLPKSKSELLLSRLKQWGFTGPDVKITSQRARQMPFSSFFTSQHGICYCENLSGLFQKLQIPLIVSEWRLFIDGSSKSLKAVLLHNHASTDLIKHPSIPIAHSVIAKESYDNTKLLLKLIEYDRYKFDIIGDFKMVAFLMGLQGGYTKFPCYICLWDSRDTSKHYKKKKWPLRHDFQVGKNNVKWEPIVNTGQILMPPLHIKLGLMKQFVKALNHELDAFAHLKEKFPELSESKITAGVFTGPQIRKLMKSEEFPNLLLQESEECHAAWNSFKAVVTGFLGNNRDDNYEQIVRTMIKNFNKMGCRMSQKMHMLDSHLNKFKDNMGKYSEEQGERFHQDMKDFEKNYQGHYDANMMADYVWSKCVKNSGIEYKRKA